MEISAVESLALALGLGLLVGLQREWSAHHLTGIRTFAPITILGALLGLLSQTLGVWLPVAGLCGVAALLIVGTVLAFVGQHEEPGLTTEIAALVMYAVGVALAYGQTELGLIIGGGVAVLLQWKQPLHTLVGRFSEPDIRAIFNLVLIALVILPVMPNRSYGPYGGAQSVRDLADRCPDRRDQSWRVHRVQVLGHPGRHAAGRHLGRHDFQHRDDGQLRPPDATRAGGRRLGGVCHHRRFDDRLRPRDFRNRGGRARVAAQGRPAARCHHAGDGRPGPGDVLDTRRRGGAGAPGQRSRRS